MKFGYEFRRSSINLTQDLNFRGKLTFPDLISFLEGFADGGSQAAGNTHRHEFENSQGLYVQDSFRVNPRLTLNLGIRWDYFGVPGEKDNLFYQLSPADGAPCNKWAPMADLRACTTRTTTISRHACRWRMT